MSIIQERYLFSWKNFQNDLQTLGDLERLKLVLESMPDAEVMRTLRVLRANGRNDHPIEAMWNSLLAGVVFEHISIESLRRELSRNAQLRELCGFNPLLGIKAVPSKSAYNRFLSSLLLHEPLIRDMFDTLVTELQNLVPKFGVNLAGDGKGIQSLGKPTKKHPADRRREGDADWGVKRYYGTDENGKAWKKVKSWFGFRLHLIVEADAELPVAYEVTQASKGEQPIMREMFAELNETHPKLISRCENSMLDKGYDSTENIITLVKVKKKSITIDGKKYRDLYKYFLTLLLFSNILSSITLPRELNDYRMMDNSI